MNALVDHLTLAIAPAAAQFAFGIPERDLALYLDAERSTRQAFAGWLCGEMVDAILADRGRREAATPPEIPPLGGS